jgi:hypothetical protein
MHADTTYARSHAGRLEPLVGGRFISTNQYQEAVTVTLVLLLDVRFTVDIVPRLLNVAGALWVSCYGVYCTLAAPLAEGNGSDPEPTGPRKRRRQRGTEASVFQNREALILPLAPPQAATCCQKRPASISAPKVGPTFRSHWVRYKRFDPQKMAGHVIAVVPVTLVAAEWPRWRLWHWRAGLFRRQPIKLPRPPRIPSDRIEKMRFGPGLATIGAHGDLRYVALSCQVAPDLCRCGSAGGFWKRVAARWRISASFPPTRAARACHREKSQ